MFVTFTLNVKLRRLGSILPLHSAFDRPSLFAGDRMDDELHTGLITSGAESSREPRRGSEYGTIYSESENLKVSDVPGHDPPVSLHGGIESHIRALQHC